MMEEIQTIANSVPNLLQYYIPGWCTYKVWSFASSCKVEIKESVLLSCTISYILLSITSLLRVRVDFIKLLPQSALIDSAISIILGILLGILFSIVYCSKLFSRALVFLFSKTVNESIWKDVIDFEEGSNLKLYLKGHEYYFLGHFINIEEKEEASWIAISAFSKRDKKTNELIKGEPCHEKNENVYSLVRLSDVEHIEIFN